MSRKRATTAHNPFRVANDEELYSMNARQQKLAKQRRKDLEKVPISERGLLGRNGLSHRELSTKYSVARPKTPDDGIEPVKESKKRRQKADQLIQERREIFLSNLLISRHQKELSRIDITQKTQEQRLVDAEIEISENTNKAKAIMNQNENILVRDRQKADEQVKRRIHVEQLARAKALAIKNLESEVTKLEDTLDVYKSYKEFFGKLKVATGIDPKTPKQVFDILEKYEMENLFLGKTIDRINGQILEATGDINEEIAGLQNDIERVNHDIQQREQLLDDLKSGNEHEAGTNADLDSKVAEIQNKITVLYRKCFPGSDSSPNSVSMLSYIESNFEALTKQAQLLDPKYIMEMNKKLTNAQRKEQRESNLQKKKEEHQQKVQQMLARATQPVKKRTGRPVVERTTVHRITKKDDLKRNKELKEKERLEKLLYGDIFTD